MAMDTVEGQTVKPNQVRHNQCGMCGRPIRRVLVPAAVADRDVPMLRPDRTPLCTCRSTIGWGLEL